MHRYHAFNCLKNILVNALPHKSHHVSHAHTGDMMKTICDTHVFTRVFLNLLCCLRNCVSTAIAPPQCQGHVQNNDPLRCRRNTNTICDTRLVNVRLRRMHLCGKHLCQHNATQQPFMDTVAFNVPTHTKIRIETVTPMHPHRSPSLCIANATCVVNSKHANSTQDHLGHPSPTCGHMNKTDCDTNLVHVSSLTDASV